MKTKIKTRIAPSPTGTLHIGTARTALFNYLFAKQNDGEFILRIDDTDRERSKPEFEASILAGLDWLNLPFDSFYRQSERTTIYEKYISQLITDGKAYLSKEETVKDGGRAEVIRFKNPNTEVTFTDLIRGDITFDTTDLGDFVIAKSVTEPLYHLASVIDDHELAISHIIRGEDHISNTPRQILLLEAIGAQKPIYAHIPLILAPDRSKLSKRHGAVAITAYRDQGYLSEAMINFMTLMGWSPQSSTEKNDTKNTKEEDVLTIEDLLQKFDITKVNKSGAIFNLEKLDWLNKEHLKRLPVDNLDLIISNTLPDDLGLEKLTSSQLALIRKIILDRITTTSDIEKMTQEGEFDFLKNIATPTIDLLKTVEYIPGLILLLESLSETDFTDPENIKAKIWDYATNKGRGEVLGPMRIALSGKEKSPDPFTLSAILGKEETIKRLRKVCY